MPPRPRRTAPAPVAARSLADEIRARTDDELTALILGRPDLARPAPADLTSLAARASTKASVQRCIETLDRAQIQVLEAVLLAGDGADPAGVARLLGTDADVQPHLDRLWELGLLWRAADGLHLVRTVPEVLGAHPAGLGPSLAELRGSVPESMTDPQAVRLLVDAAPAGARAILDSLAWGPPVGVLNPEGPGAAAARWLLERQLIAPLSAERVVLPREVGLALRGGRIHRETTLSAPEAATTNVGAAVVDSVAGGQASDLLVLVEEVAARWGPEPPRVLRTGGLSVRDLRRVTEALDLEPDRAAYLLELIHAAGLVADDGELVPVWAPTAAFDEWLGHEAGARWAQLASAWRTSTRAAHLVGTKPSGGTSPANALGPDIHWPPIRAIRAEVLAELARLGPGQAPTTASLVERLLWRRPLRNARLLTEAATGVLREAEWLGVTGRGALSSAGQALLDGAEGAELARSMSTCLPPPVDHILLQADLTAIAPGPLEGSLAQLMRLSAEVESRGGATVYRLTPHSVRRALDTGWTADELVESLRRSSRTGVPQPVEYLVRDVARRHGQTRIGGATAYIRSDDEAVLETMLADRSLSTVQLRKVAPTVLISPADPRVLIEVLREAGYAPVQEGPDGSVVISMTAQRRASGRRSAPAPAVAAVDVSFTSALVEGLRAAEDSADYLRAQTDASQPRLLATDPTVTLAALREAAADRRGVWIGYADPTGRTTKHLFYPVRVEGGRAFGTLADSTEERAFSIHRVTGVAPC